MIPLQTATASSSFSRTLPSLQEYVVVAQHGPDTGAYRRQGGGAWLLTEVTGLEVQLTLSSIDATIPLAEIYDKVEFPPD
jgi:hypothetical protein